MAIKEITVNKKAFFDYFVEEKIEAGLSLVGSEVKSAKMGYMNIADSFCFVDGGELILKNCHITPYEKGSYYNPDARRDRKLLLHKKEIARLIGKVKEKGFTLVPLRAYFKGRFLKIELGLCRGKKAYDKKETIKARDLDRQAERDIKEYFG
jgi:SsrA-binding protein